MTSFPSSVVSYPTLVDLVDSPLAAHENSQGDELTAIQNYLLNTIQNHNLLINGGFQFWQRLATPTTATTMTDDVYNAPDRWYSLVQGAGATINRNAGIGTSQYSAKLIAGGTTNRYGIAQIVEAENSIPMRGNVVSAGVRIKPVNNAGSGTRDYRIAILEWTGTADTVTSELVADWTSSTYTTAGFFASTTKTLVGTATVTATHNTETVLSVSGTVSASCNNLIVFVWTEDVPTHASDYVLIGEAGLYKKVFASQTWYPRPQAAELALCQRYFYSIISVDSYFLMGFGQAISTTEARILIGVPAKFFRSPTVSVSNVAHFVLTGATFTVSANPSSIAISKSSTDVIVLTVSGVSAILVAGDATMLAADSSDAAAIFMDAEL